jgi:hypothetical protein
LSTQAFVYSGGAYTALTPPAPNDVLEARGINSGGDIVGYLAEPGDVEEGFALVGGTYSVLDFPGSVNTSAGGVNDAGDIVGYYTVLSNGSYVQYGFLAVPELVTPEPPNVLLFSIGIAGVLGFASLNRGRVPLTGLWPAGAIAARGSTQEPGEGGLRRQLRVALFGVGYAVLSAVRFGLRSILARPQTRAVPDQLA